MALRQEALTNRKISEMNATTKQESDYTGPWGPGTDFGFSFQWSFKWIYFSKRLFGYHLETKCARDSSQDVQLRWQIKTDGSGGRKKWPDWE